MNDIQLTVAALEACGYRTRVRETAGTKWVAAVKGLDVQYHHWHPLTNINQAMQLLIEAPRRLQLNTTPQGAWINDYPEAFPAYDPRGLISAQCRAIINACAALNPVK